MSDKKNKNIKKEENKDLDPTQEMLETTCYNCSLKAMCIVVNNIYSPVFKAYLNKISEHQKNNQNFYEYVEKFLARICKYFHPKNM
jgi:hypothetical protein